MRRVSIVISAVMIAISLYVIVAARSFPGASNGAPGPGFFPTILAIIIIGLSISLIIKENGVNRDSDEPVFRNNFLKVVICAVIMAAYIILMEYISYIYVTPVAIAALMLDFEEKRPLPIIITALGTTLAIYVVFYMVLAVRLPQGMLF